MVKEYITLKKETDTGFIATVTQEYDTFIEGGHYIFVLSDLHGNILKTTHTSASPPKEKVTLKHLDDFLRGCKYDMTRYCNNIIERISNQ